MTYVIVEKGNIVPKIVTANTPSDALKTLYNCEIKKLNNDDSTADVTITSLGDKRRITSFYKVARNGINNNFMKVININDSTYLLKKIYLNRAIYQEVAPSGASIANSYLLVDNGKKIMFPSYACVSILQVEQAVDNHIATGRYNIQVLHKDGYSVVHPSGGFI